MNSRKNKEYDVLSMVKGDEQYVFIYTGKNERQMLKTLTAWAMSPELSLSWYDAACLMERVRQDKLLEEAPAMKRKQNRKRVRSRN